MRRTEIVQLASGHEQRTSRWSRSRRRFDAGYGLKSAADLALVATFFEAREGRRFSFRWRDPFDYRSSLPGHEISPTDQILETGDGVEQEFGLRKIYESGGNTVVRPIAFPDTPTVRVAVDGTEVPPSAFSVLEEGQIALSVAPNAGAVVTAGFQFDIPARFDTDELSMQLELGGGSVPSIPIIEVLA